MPSIHFFEILSAVQESNLLWIIIPIFFVGIITDKYQEEFGTSIGNAVSNGAMIMFSAFSWLELIFSRTNFPLEGTISQLLLSGFVIVYGFFVVASGFRSGEFAVKYGRTRVVTFMLMFFTMIIYVPVLYNFVSVLIFVLIFPMYYAAVTEFLKLFPTIEEREVKVQRKDFRALQRVVVYKPRRTFMRFAKEKIEEYLE